MPKQDNRQLNHDARAEVIELPTADHNMLKTAATENRLIATLDSLNRQLKKCLDETQALSALLGNGGFKWSASKQLQAAKEAGEA